MIYRNRRRGKNRKREARTEKERQKIHKTKDLEKFIGRICNGPKTAIR